MNRIRALFFCRGVRILVLLLGLQLLGSVQAAENHWTGTVGDHLWRSAANWSLGVVPDYSQDVFVAQTGTNAVILDVSATVGSLIIGNAGADAAALNLTGGQFQCYGDCLVASNAVLSLGIDYFGYGQMTDNGTVNWTAGELNAWIATVSPGANFNISGTGAKGLASRFLNNGTVFCLATNVTAWPGCYFTNANRMVIQSDFTLSQNPGNFPYPEFHNQGTILLPPGLGLKKLAFGLQSFSQGIIDVETNSVLEIAAAYNTIEFQNGSAFNGPGLIRLPLNSSATFDGLQTINGTLEYAGNSFFGGWPTWTGPGLLRWTGGGMGNFTFASGFQVQMTGSDDKTFTGSCTNLGTVEWQSSGRLLSQGSSGFINLGQFVIESNCVLDSMGWPSGSFTNAGIVLRAAGTGAAQLRAFGTPFINQGTIEVDTNAVLELLGAQLLGGSVFNGAGLLRVPLNSSVTLDGLLTVNGTVEFDGSSWMGWPTWTGPGLLRWTGGSMSGFTFAPGFHTDMAGPDDKTFTGSCTNLGTVQWQSSGRLLSQGSSGFVNLGQFVIESNCVLDSMGWPSGSFTNAGIVLRAAGTGTAQLQALGTPFINQGTIEVDTNAVLELLGAQLLGGSVFNGAGLLRVPLNSSVTLDGTLTVNGTVEFAGNSWMGWPTWTGPGLLRWTGGGMNGFTFAPDFHVDMTGPDNKSFSGSSTNLGIVCWTGNSSVFAGTSATFVNGGRFLIKTNGSWDATLSFNNQSGGTFQQIAGQFSLGTLNNSGTLKLEKGVLNPGSLASGSGGSYQTRLSGTTPGSGFNQLNAQYLALDGSLLVTLTNGFVPTNGSSFVIATGMDRAGQFASVILPPAQSNLTWRVRYTASEVILQAAPPLAMNGSAHLGDGRFQFTLSGPASGGYVIQASTNLVDWQIIETNRPFTGNVIFTDPDADQAPHRFYRCQIFD